MLCESYKMRKKCLILNNWQIGSFFFNGTVVGRMRRRFPEGGMVGEKTDVGGNRVVRVWGERKGVAGGSLKRETHPPWQFLCLHHHYPRLDACSQSR
ncbi:hypothetical protein L2E82_05869 [Cichorium intybus]|uniref:Uncharacterized protein n=1 Tax=Cichorium intybus TaxID=13427 RepID=A0ACB9H8C8_CICIN|nr:hypothetical protein L2E82_05869 [Cichorium intybus]